MSMIVVLVKLDTRLMRDIVKTGGNLLSDLLDGRVELPNFNREQDVWEEIDYRDLKAASDDDDPVMRLFNGSPLLEDYTWTYGPPVYFDPEATANLFDLMVDGLPCWPFLDISNFIGSAVEEQKGVVAGVA